MARRQHLTLMVAFSVVAFLTLTYMLSNSGQGDRYPVSYSHKKQNNPTQLPSEKSKSSPDGGAFAVPSGILSGGSIAPKLENATAKAELGRATWKFLHTTMARFPEKPTEEDSMALKTFIHLFGRLYPCGDCAAHFRKMLEKYPPQVSSRNAAVGWACFVHNEVNTRLKKPQFDCGKIGDFYDCGCGDDKGKKAGKKEGEKVGEKAVKAQERAGVTMEKEG